MPRAVDPSHCGIRYTRINANRNWSSHDRFIASSHEVRPGGWDTSKLCARGELVDYSPFSLYQTDYMERTLRAEARVIAQVRAFSLISG